MFQVQHIWRTLSKDTFGWYVWEIIEVMPDERGHYLFTKNFDPTIDGGYIMPVCTHFFTEERAREYYDEPADVYQSVVWLA